MPTTTIFAGFYCDYSWHTKGYWFSSKKEIVLLPKKKKARSQVHLKQVDTVATKAIINLSACHILNLIINTRLLGPPIFPISQISVMLSHFVLRQRLDSVLLIFSISFTQIIPTGLLTTHTFIFFYPALFPISVFTPQLYAYLCW